MEGLCRLLTVPIFTKNYTDFYLCTLCFFCKERSPISLGEAHLFFKAYGIIAFCLSNIQSLFLPYDSKRFYFLSRLGGQWNWRSLLGRISREALQRELQFCPFSFLARHLYVLSEAPAAILEPWGKLENRSCILRMVEEKDRRTIGILMTS